LYQDPHNQPKLRLVYGDLTDGSNLASIISEIKPDEIYNLGAQSHVRVSFDTPIYTTNTNALGTLRLLEAIRTSGRQVKFYQASSSEMFGKVAQTPQNENTPFYPRSPYACSKVCYWQTINYREAYGMFAATGFYLITNHRGEVKLRNQKITWRLHG
jgi:GDPmannose 4,6-dehydratase